MQWKEKQYWYFVTGENMGTTMTLKPRTPYGMSDDEPECKRICVAPTAAHCMSALDVNCKLQDERKLYIYRTRRTVKARVPYNVYDAHITQEHWLHTPTRFTLVDILHIPSNHNWLHLHWEEEGQRRNQRAIKSWCARRSPALCTKRHANNKWKSPRTKMESKVE